jgi:hypothetical protein
MYILLVSNIKVIETQSQFTGIIYTEENFVLTIQYS